MVVKAMVKRVTHGFFFGVCGDIRLEEKALASKTSRRAHIKRSAAGSRSSPELYAELADFFDDPAASVPPQVGGEGLSLKEESILFLFY